MGAEDWRSTWSLMQHQSWWHVWESTYTYTPAEKPFINHFDLTTWYSLPKQCPRKNHENVPLDGKTHPCAKQFWANMEFNMSGWATTQDTDWTWVVSPTSEIVVIGMDLPHFHLICQVLALIVHVYLNSVVVCLLLGSWTWGRGRANMKKFPRAVPIAPSGCHHAKHSLSRHGTKSLKILHWKQEKQRWVQWHKRENWDGIPQNTSWYWVLFSQLSLSSIFLHDH